ncbi:MAG: T9SS type A sorting domain-containing protein [candidate division KSB1 bacterium]|nr:T9SS type A sorting domain-containing protein [candidate division KSB1 bacterium]
MRKALVVTTVLLLAASAVLASDSRITLLKPYRGVDEDAIIYATKKDLNNGAVDRLLTPSPLSKFAGIIDTIAPPLAETVNFGAAPGDTMAQFFQEPTAAYYLKSIAVKTNEWSGQFNDGFNLFVTKAAADIRTWPKDSVDGKGWVGRWASHPLGCTTGNWCGSSWGQPPLGEIIWGDFPVTAVRNEWVWTPMIWLGFEPDMGHDPFYVCYAPFGTAGQNFGTASGDATALPEWRGLKYYAGGGTSGKGGWHIRHYGWIFYLEVEFYENTPPKIEYEPYGSVLNADPRPLRAHMEDLDASDPAKAGIAEAKLYYNVNGGAFSSVAMTLVEGTDANGTWEGVVPGGIIGPGDVVEYYFWAKDKNGLEAESIHGSYGYFVKKHDVLAVYNDNTFTASFIMPYYFHDPKGVEYLYDTWWTDADGPPTTELYKMYNWIVQLDGSSPLYLFDDDVVAAWLTGAKKSSGTKGYFWSSQEWAYGKGGGVDLNFAAGQIQYDYFGIGTIVSDIQPYNQNAHPLNATDHPIVKDIKDFCADSLQLYYDSYYELGFANWNDAITATNPAATVLFADSADANNVMGLYNFYNNVHTVFLTFDQLALNTGKAKYHWIPIDVSNPMVEALKHFGAPSAVRTGETVPVEYALHQNYPNPFNPTTTVKFAVAKPGNVTIAVYNMLGQKVATLVNGYHQAGTYAATWDATGMASGVYFYKIEAGDFTAVKKMTLLR